MFVQVVQGTSKCELLLLFIVDGLRRDGFEIAFRKIYVKIVGKLCKFGIKDATMQLVFIFSSYSIMKWL